MAIFGGDHGLLFRNAVWAGAPECFPNQPDPCVLSTGHSDDEDRVRVQWDFVRTDDLPGGDPCLDAGAPRPCYNVVMRSYKAQRNGNIERTCRTATCESESIRYRPCAQRPALRVPRCWEGGQLGPDRWGVVSGSIPGDPTVSGPRRDKRPRAYLRDTRGDNVVTTCKVPGGGNERQQSNLSERAHPGMQQVRRWEHGGWKQNPLNGAYQAAMTLFHGWEGGRGPYDCEPLARELFPGRKSWGTFAIYSLGDGWEGMQ
jgi:hypothetical protein